MGEIEEIAEEVKNNYSDYSIDDEDPWHHEVEKIIRKRVLKVLKKYCKSDSIVLNAGSGGEDYPCKGKLIHLDLVEKNIKKFKDHIVASITDIPCEDQSVDIVICVGSVINYTDAEKAINEFSRLLKPNGSLILEFERSDSADFITK
ncbi:MAG: class I SAM-dependent methyltransferase [Bacilli bacterium]|jgi:SAM-dependent methyltransferase|nr:class I SAM-dependent methyltransferase [Bacilli bacterium]